MAAAARHPKITVRILPYARGAYPGMATGRFEILRFSWLTDLGVVYIEHRAGGFYLEQR